MASALAIQGLLVFIAARTAKSAEQRARRVIWLVLVSIAAWVALMFGPSSDVLRLLVGKYGDTVALTAVTLFLVVPSILAWLILLVATRENGEGAPHGE